MSLAKLLEKCVHTPLAGLPKAWLAPLRATLNVSARLITGSRKLDHITPDLIQLNWLSIEARIHFKIACLTHKAIHYNTPFTWQNNLSSLALVGT